MKHVIIAISEWGYWGEELIGPLEACDQAGYTVEFLTPTGAKPTPLSASMQVGVIDPPQGKSVVSPEMAGKTRRARSIESAGPSPEPVRVVTPPPVSQLAHLPPRHGGLL